MIYRVGYELEALHLASHENVLRVYGLAEWEGSIALITELMHGGNLRLLLGNVSVDLRPVLQLRICEEISSGLAFIHNIKHNKGQVHGDLKPDNVLLSKDLHCKIGDFGSSRIVSFTGRTTATDVGQVKAQFTKVYAAPERLRDPFTRPRRHQDAYSYGLIVYEVLSRELPHQFGVSEEDYLRAIKNGRRPGTEIIDELKKSSSNAKDKEVIQVLKNVMMKCWQNKPEDRPDMRDIRNELQQLMSTRERNEVTQSVAKAQESYHPYDPSSSNQFKISLDCFVPFHRFNRSG